MTRFTKHPTPIEGLEVIERKLLWDERGFFSRFFCREEWDGFGFEGGIAQINHSRTLQRGTVRGMHFQHPPDAETKFVSCLEGKVFDVAVDVRPESPTYRRWHGEVLSAENARSMLIPRGCAHGFQALTDNCELIYLHDKPYAPSSQGGLNALDPKLAIPWPLAVSQISQRDRALPMLSE